MFTRYQVTGTLVAHNGSFTLPKFVSETISNSDMKQYLPWPPWLTQQEIETILSVSRCPRWPMQVNSECCCHLCYPLTFANVNMALNPLILLAKWICYQCCLCLGPAISWLTWIVVGVAAFQHWLYMSMVFVAISVVDYGYLDHRRLIFWGM